MMIPTEMSVLTDSEEKWSYEYRCKRRETLQKQRQHAGTKRELFRQRCDDVIPNPQKILAVIEPEHWLCKQ